MLAKPGGGLGSTPRISSDSKEATSSDWLPSQSRKTLGSSELFGLKEKDQKK